MFVCVGFPVFELGSHKQNFHVDCRFTYYNYYKFHLLQWKIYLFLFFKFTIILILFLPVDMTCLITLDL